MRSRACIGRLRRATPVLLAAAATWLLAPREAAALEWPDVAERVERDLQASDASLRRGAAASLVTLGPGRGAPLALRALEDPETDVRLAAADAAIRLRASGATDAVASWLNSPEPRLRRKACEVARAMPSPRAVAPLARSLGDPDADVRAAAAEALGRQASADAVPPLLGRLDDPAPQARVQIVAALARLGDPRAVVPLVGKVQDSAPEVRGAVARALADLGDPRASPALVLALRDQNTEVRREALGALGRVRADSAVDAIAPFVSDRAPALRLAALAALGQIASVDAVRILVQALGTGEDAGGTLDPTPLRDALITAGPAAVAPLRALLLASPSPAATTSAAFVLGALRAQAEAPSILAAMRRGTLPVAAALRALAGAGTAADVPTVLEFIADGNPTVRQEALAAALVLLDPRQPDGRAVEPLAAALRDGRVSGSQRAELATLLGRTGAARAVPLLAELTRAHDPPLRLAALDALGALGESGAPSGREADAALLEALAAPDPAVRLHAAVALGDCGSPDARDALLSELDGGSEVDRPAVLLALGGLLSRAPSEAAVVRLASHLELAAGPERDSLLDALGRASIAPAVEILLRASRSDETWDRREAAILLAGHAGDAEATAAARRLAADADGDVRAQAAWSLGTLGDASDEARLLVMSRDHYVALAANATTALGRLAARRHDGEMSARTLCPLTADPRAEVRAAALAGLALASKRCGDGSVERRALRDDPSEDVRAAAARLIAGAPAAGDARTLERCARSDPSGSVASQCRAGPHAAGKAHAVLVYVVAEAAALPRPGATYALQLADGTIRRGSTDRRGAVFEPAAPDGPIALRPATAR